MWNMSLFPKNEENVEWNQSESKLEKEKNKNWKFVTIFTAAKYMTAIWQ